MSHLHPYFSAQKERNRHKRYARELKKYFSPVYYNSAKKYIKRDYRSSSRNNLYGYLKKLSNRKVRKQKGKFTGKGNLYRRQYDLWWNWM